MVNHCSSTFFDSLDMLFFLKLLKIWLLFLKKTFHTYKTVLCIYLVIITRMSHWHQQMVDGAEFWISCKWLKVLRKASQWQLIKLSAPSNICWCQFDIRMHWNKQEYLFDHTLVESGPRNSFVNVCHFVGSLLTFSRI